MSVHPNMYTSNTAPHTLLLYMPMTTHVCHSGDSRPPQLPLPGSAGTNKSEKEVLKTCPVTLHFISKPQEALVFTPKFVAMLSFH